MTLSELEGTTSRGSGGGAHEAVGRAILGPHVGLGDMLNAVTEPGAPDAGPQRMRQLAAGFIAGACSHLGGVEETILPIARRRLPHGRGMVAEYVAHARELERALHRLNARLYGEAHASRQPHRTPWPRIGEWLVEHAERESVLLDSVLWTVTAEEAHVLARRIAYVAEHAPTRPHPYAPHTGLAGRVSHRVLGVADGFWDGAQGRSIPHATHSQAIPRNSLLTAYVLGVPTFDDTSRSTPAEGGLKFP
jgi:hypothetical protein